MELKKLFNYDVVISASDNEGLIVKIGCGTFCYSGAASFLHDLKEFLKDPETWEKKYNQSRQDRPDQPEQCEAQTVPEPTPTLTGSGDSA